LNRFNGFNLEAVETAFYIISVTVAWLKPGVNEKAA